MISNNFYTNINYLTGTTNYPNPQDLPEESDKIYKYDEFFSEILTKLRNFHSPKERLNHFLTKLTLTQPERDSDSLQAECWISKELSNKLAFLHLVVEADGYYSTIFPCDPNSETKYVYLNLAEWEPNRTGGTRHEPLVQIRVDLESGKGEWMWIRKSPSFSGTTAIEFAKSFSEQFLTEAEMWDTAKVYENDREVSIATWGLMAREKPEFLYSRAGFEMPTLSVEIKAKNRKFVQHKELHASAVHYLRNLDIKTITAALSAKKDKAALKTLVRKHKCTIKTTLTTLCQKVDQACRKQLQNSIRDKLFLYDFVTGEHKISSEKVATAIGLVHQAPLLRAHHPFTAQTFPSDTKTLSLFNKTYSPSKKPKIVSFRISKVALPRKQDQRPRFSLVIGAQNQSAILADINRCIAQA